MERVNLIIDGMSCGHCVGAVRAALARLRGVTAEDVAVGSARLSYDPEQASVAQIVDAIREEGFAVRSVAAP